MGNYGYEEDALKDAKDMAEHFIDEMVEQLQDKGEASTDYNNDYDGGDSYHHETHVDKDYDLLDAAQLLDDLDEYEETDYGLWEGLMPRKAIVCQAAFTYGNAVSAKWQRIIEDINDDYEQWKEDVDNEGRKYDDLSEEDRVEWTKEWVLDKIKEW